MKRLTATAFLAICGLEKAQAQLDVKKSAMKIDLEKFKSLKKDSLVEEFEYAERLTVAHDRVREAEGNVKDAKHRLAEYKEHVGYFSTPLRTIGEDESSD